MSDNDNTWPENVPPTAAPWLTACIDYACTTITACLLGDSDGLDATADAMVYEQNRFMAAAIPAGSGAATELDYYGQERP